MDFSCDLVSKRDFTLTSKMLSKAYHCPLKFNSPSSSVSLPSIHELGIIFPFSGNSPAGLSSGYSTLSNKNTHASKELLSYNQVTLLHRSRAPRHKKDVLNSIFKQYFFPSTKLRAQLAQDLNMTPRAVQIWFQNKRQIWRAKHKKPLPHNISGDITSSSPLNKSNEDNHYTKVHDLTSLFKAQGRAES